MRDYGNPSEHGGGLLSAKTVRAGRKLRVLIADDEPLARRFLRRLLLCDPDIGELRHCEDGVAVKSQLVLWNPDILFLDVQMPGVDGIQALESLPVSQTPVTVFTTAYSQHAVKAFELQACDYLLKPFDEVRFVQALARAKSLVGDPTPPSRSKVLPVRDGSRTILLDPAEVDFVCSEDNYVRIRTRGRFYLRRATLASVERLLTGATFLRVHRRFLVNVAKVKELYAQRRGLELILTDGSRVPASRAHKGHLKSLLDAR